METLQRLHNRGSISTGYDIDNSLKLEADNNEWLYRSSPTAGNRRTYTYSFWIKRTGLGTVNASGTQYVMGAGQHGRMFFGGNYFQYRFDNGHTCRNVTRKFRDTAAWYHFVVAVDTTQSTASNRVKLYVNGDTLEVDDHDGGSFPDQNDEGAFFSTNYFAVGTGVFGGGYDVGDGAYDMRAYLAEVCGVDGQQLAPTDFGEYNDDGIWIPKDVSSINFGNEGFYLDFEDSSSLGADDSGNSNNFSLSNITSADQATDTPTNNFCLPQTTQYYNGTDDITFTEGGTKLTTGSGTGWRTMQPTMSLANGKWYFELEAPATNPTSSYIMIAITPTKRWTATSYANFYGGQTDGTGLGFYLDSTRFRYDDGSAIAPPTNTINAGDIIGIALDMDNNKAYASINGSWVQNQSSVTGVPTSGSSGTGAETVADEPHMIGISMYSPSKTVNINYGGYTTISIASAASDANGYGTFEYAPPSGYYAICTKNLAEYG